MNRRRRNRVDLDYLDDKLANLKQNEANRKQQQQQQPAQNQPSKNGVLPGPRIAMGAAGRDHHSKAVVRETKPPAASTHSHSSEDGKPKAATTNKSSASGWMTSKRNFKPAKSPAKRPPSPEPESSTKTKTSSPMDDDVVKSQSPPELASLSKKPNDDDDSDSDDSDDSRWDALLGPKTPSPVKAKNSQTSVESPKAESQQSQRSQQESQGSKGGGIKTTKQGLSLTFSESDDDDNDNDKHSDDKEHKANRRHRRRSKSDSQDDENSSGDDEDDTTPKAQGNRAVEKAKPSRLSSSSSKKKARDSDDDADSDMDSGSESEKKMAATSSSRKKEIARRNKIRRRQREESSSSERSDSSDNSGDDSSSSYEYHRRRRRKAPRNPLTLQREQNAALFEAKSPGSSTKKPSQNDSDDGFMSDCDPPVKSPVAASTEKPKAKKKRDRSTSEQSSEKAKRKKRKKTRRDTNDNEDDADVSRSLEYNGYDDEDVDDDALKDLKPTFEDPKFGPFELEPLVLADKDDNQVAVPASLSRYLAPFQKEGIEFMYKCLARKSGVILGDDMGLGKTVQVIGLLCALFEKTGTGQDLKDINDRKKKVSRHVLDVRKMKDDAVCRGEMVEEDDDEWTQTLGVSPWHPVLVVVPPAVISNWLQSFEMFSHFSVSEYDSKKATQAIDAVRYGNAEVLLCRESLFKSEDHFKRINSIDWKLVVIDEFHTYKNEKTKGSIHVRGLKQSRNPLMLGMTGTLMQNNHKELWNLVDLIQTNFLGTWEDFQYSFDRKITLGRQKGATTSAEKLGEDAAKELRSKLKRIMIERTKVDVLGDKLPDKDEQVVLCSLSKLQKEVYRHIIELPDFELVKKAQAPCDCGINQNFFQKFKRLSNKAERLEFYRRNKDQIVKQSQCCKKIPINPQYGEEGEPKVDPDAVIWRTLDVHNVNEDTALYGCKQCPHCCAFPCMAKLMKLSSHLGLLQADKGRASHSAEANRKYLKDREFAKVALAGVVKKLPGGDYDRHDGIMNDHFALSGKLEMADRLLQKYQREGCKVLLFSHSTQTLDLIQNYLKSRGTMTYLRLDGSLSTERRKELTDQFQSDRETFLFLLSTKAAGLGLNLTAASRVILFDQNWNPAWDDQAQDRAYRIGQTQNVHVVRLVAQGTVEEMVYIRQIYKKMLKQGTLSEDEWSHLSKLFRGVQGDKSRKGELFGYENLFRFKDGSFLDDIWVGAKGKKDSSGLKIHKSGQLSEVLKNNIEFEDKLQDVENVEILEALSERAEDKAQASEKKDEFDLHDPDSEDESDDDVAKPLKERVRVVTHKDIFFKDKGGAAIAEGEEGYEEEMGGGTQNAYAVYEQKKDSINSDDDDDDDAASVGAASHHSGNSYVNERNTGSPPPPDAATLKPEATRATCEDPEEVQSAVAGKLDAVPAVDSARANDGAKTIDIKEESLSDSKPSTESGDMEKTEKSSKARVVARQTSKKAPSKGRAIQLAGLPDVQNAKTEFSMADLQLPTYAKKKKKKKTEST